MPYTTTSRVWDAVKRLGYNMNDFEVFSYRAYGADKVYFAHPGESGCRIVYKTATKVDCHYARKFDENFAIAMALMIAYLKFGYVAKEEDRYGDGMTDGFFSVNVLNVKRL